MGKIIDDTLGTNIFGSNSTDKAIRAQTQAAEQANATQRYIYDSQRADYEPWRQAGLSALGEIQKNEFMDNWQTDPGYEFRMKEGQKAIDAAGLARGISNSGRALKELTRYGQDFASNEYDKVYNRQYGRLAGLAGIGQSATNATANASQNYGNAVSSNQIGLGNAIGSANIAQANRNAALGQQAISIGSAYAFSDLRLKTNIRKFEISRFKDVPTYEFEYIDKNFGSGKFVGVMAQDLLAINPNHPAVVETKHGYAVDYSQLEVA